MVQDYNEQKAWKLVLIFIKKVFNHIRLEFMQGNIQEKGIKKAKSKTSIGPQPKEG